MNSSVPTDFTKKEYWEKFSSNLGKIQFEWYGKWNELAEICDKYVKPKDYTLHVGIGRIVIFSVWGLVLWIPRIGQNHLPGEFLGP